MSSQVCCKIGSCPALPEYRVRQFSLDTDADARRVMVEGLRRMSPSEKLARVVALNRSVELMARAGIRLRTPNISDADLRNEMAKLWLDEDTLKAALEKARNRASSA